MSLNAVKQISTAEAAAEQRRAEAYALAKQKIAEAESVGQALVKQKIDSAAGASDALISEARQRSHITSEEIKKRTEHECEKIEQNANGKMQKAVAIIIERIVNG